MSHSVSKVVLAAGALVVSCVAMGQVAEASTVTIATNSANYTGTGGGGEFAITSIQNYSPPGLASVNKFTNIGGLSNVFQSFCLEKNEELVSGNTYNYTISTRAFHGGIGLIDRSGKGVSGTQQDGTAATGDPICAATAWLFTQFWNGTLLHIDDPATGAVEDFSYNYTFGSGRASSATDLQFAIYALEDETAVSGLTGASKAYFDAAINAVTTGAWTGLGSVRVMNLTSLDANGNVIFNQDLLIMVPLPPAVWAGFGLMSVIGLAGIVRRRRLQTLA